MEAFQVEKLKENLYCITETKSVNMYLLLGEKEALLIDTGYGYVPVGEVIKELTNLPLKVIVTHGDMDHALGSYQFNQVYIHPADIEDLIISDRNKELKMNTIDYRLKKMPELSSILDKDKYAETSLKNVQFLPVIEGDVIDLGGISIKVIGIPGHSRGHIALFEECNGWLFTGDTITKHNIWNLSEFDHHCMPLSTLMKSYTKIQNMGEQVKEIYPAHNIKPIQSDNMEEWKECIRDLVKNSKNDEYIETFAGGAYRHIYKERILLYTKEMLLEALKNGIE